MSDANIEVYFRARPTKNISPYVSFDCENSRFEVKKELSNTLVNNTRTEFSFQFSKVFDMSTKQDAIFDQVAKDSITDCMNGINSTIFAYGQTGSGKTYTMTGGVERYEDRGLIPRTISYLFEEKKRRKNEMHMEFYISYLEIYNDDAYDLLSSSTDSLRRIDDLNRVHVREDENANVSFKNLSVNQSESLEEALNLLFLGDTNRIIAETPMNDASSRSHCIFIIWVKTRIKDVVRKAKLHLVDLAGSERVHKTATSVDAKTQREACNINLALFHLEQVISELHNKSRHVSYRNSTMTKVLRDSLGGNCKTRMIATASLDPKFLEETISTCRFAQNVAQIRNYAVVNEDIDPLEVIARLKEENKALKEEIRLLKGEFGHEETPTTEMEEQCEKILEKFLFHGGAIPVTSNTTILHLYFRLLKERILRGGQGTSGDNNTGSSGSEENETLQLRINELNEVLRIKEVESNALISKISKLEALQKGEALADKARDDAMREMQNEAPKLSGRYSSQLDSLMKTRAEEFEEFKKSSKKLINYNERIGELKMLCDDIKQIAAEATTARDVTIRLTKSLASLRFDSPFLMGGESTQGGRDAEKEREVRDEERRILSDIERNTLQYKSLTNVLREKKNELEFLKKNISFISNDVQNEFNNWIGNKNITKVVMERDATRLVTNRPEEDVGSECDSVVSEVTNNSSTAGRRRSQLKEDVRRFYEMSNEIRNSSS